MVRAVVMSAGEWGQEGGGGDRGEGSASQTKLAVMGRMVRFWPRRGRSEMHAGVNTRNWR